MQSGINKKAFTLLEVIFSVSLVGLIMTVASLTIFQYFQVWTDVSNRDVLKDHADSFTDYFQSTLRDSLSAVYLAEDSNEGAIAWKALPGESGLSTAYLSFKLNEKPMVLASENDNAGSIEAYLSVEEEHGCFLLWKFEVDKVEDAQDLQKSLITPFLKKIEYVYYDTEFSSWDKKSEPPTSKDEWEELPSALSFYFEKGEENYESLIYLPVVTATIPMP